VSQYVAVVPGVISRSAYCQAVDQHLSIFRPYDRDPKHEDQLTRAALIVMRLVPLCQEAFLGLADCPRLSALPRPRFDMQTESLVALDIEVEDPTVDELVSVFLGPHEDLGAGTDELNLASERRARYDGVIQYGTALVIVIESKLYASASEQQALEFTQNNLAITGNDGFPSGGRICSTGGGTSLSSACWVQRRLRYSMIFSSTPR
jgi:hypothetical protein